MGQRTSVYLDDDLHAAILELEDLPADPADTAAAMHARIRRMAPHLAPTKLVSNANVRMAAHRTPSGGCRRFNRDTGPLAPTSRR